MRRRVNLALSTYRSWQLHPIKLVISLQFEHEWSGIVAGQLHDFFVSRSYLAHRSPSMDVLQIETLDGVLLNCEQFIFPQMPLTILAQTYPLSRTDDIQPFVVWHIADESLALMPLYCKGGV